MKKLLPIIASVILPVILSGCYFQSFHPFYTDDLIVEIPAINGNWRLVNKGYKNVAENYPQAWVFTQDEIVTFESNVSSVLDANYFAVGNVTFVDLMPAEPGKDKGPNAWWTIHIVPVHTVWKVDLSGDSLSLALLDGEWVKKMLEEKKLSLSTVAIDDEGLQNVLTSSSEELVLFLKQYGEDIDAFPVEKSLRFQR